MLTFSEMLPALPLPSVATEIVPPLLIAKVGVDTATSPAFPVFDAVLNNPLARLPLPEMEIELVAVTAKFPPPPAPVVLLTTCAPPVCVRLLTFSEILPALPPPEVATDIVPPSAMPNVGTDTVISPAFPALDAVLKSAVAA